MQIQLNPQVNSRLLTWLMVAIFTQTLYGCGAIKTSIQKRNLDVQTKMSETIFLEPAKPSDKVIFVSVRNTTDQELNIKKQIVEELKKSGYTITQDPDEAIFMLQGNVLKLEKSDLRSVNAYVAAGYGGAIGAVVGSVVTDGRTMGAVGGGLIGATFATVSELLVEDIIYVMVTDLQVRERPRKGEIVEQRQFTSTHQGTSTGLQQRVTGGQVGWKTYGVISWSTRFPCTSHDGEFTRTREPCTP